MLNTPNQDMAPVIEAALAKDAVRPTSGAAPFEFDEIFFSRTDKRGVIQAFNDIFVRIADHPSEKLKGAPHKIIRNPDMPKGVFWLLWEGIQSGNAVGSYVKNRAADGLHYWVYALVAPLEDGYLSVRIKPSSDHFEAIQKIYADLLAREKNEGLTPAESAAALVETLQGMGYPNYFGFQVDALVAEYNARHRQLGRKPDQSIADLMQLVKAARETKKDLDQLAIMFRGANLLTLNMQVIATKLRSGRRTISEIARNYGMMLGELQTHLDQFEILVRGEGVFAAAIEELVLYEHCSTKLMEEVCEAFDKTQTVFAEVDNDFEAETLRRVTTNFTQRTAQTVIRISDHVRDLRRNLDFLRRLIVGLSTVRIACRVESGVLNTKNGGLDTIVTRLDQLQEEIAGILDRMEQASALTLEAMDDFQQIAKRKEREQLEENKWV